MDGKRFVAERLSLSQEGEALQQQHEALPVAGDQDSTPLLQEQEIPKQVSLPLSFFPQEGGTLPQQQILPLARDQDPMPLLQEQESPLLEIPTLKPSPLPVYPVCIEHFFLPCCIGSDTVRSLSRLPLQTHHFL